MADNDGGGGSSSVGIVAILLMFIIVIVGGFLAYRAGVFGGKKTEVDINISKPK